jgi:hypothetical protein
MPTKPDPAGGAECGLVRNRHCRPPGGRAPEGNGSQLGEPLGTAPKRTSSRAAHAAARGDTPFSVGGAAAALWLNATGHHRRLTEIGLGAGRPRLGEFERGDGLARRPVPEFRGDGRDALDSRAKCNRAMQTGFARLCQALIA